MYSLSVPGKPSALAAVSAFVIAVAHEAHLSSRKMYRLRLAVDELVTNIVQHGYQGCDDCGRINVWVEITEHTISVTVEDTSPPFDFTHRDTPPDLHLPPEERAVGGLGIYLISQYVDDILYEHANGHNINRLTLQRD